MTIYSSDTTLASVIYSSITTLASISIKKIPVEDLKITPKGTELVRPPPYWQMTTDKLVFFRDGFRKEASHLMATSLKLLVAQELELKSNLRVEAFFQDFEKQRVFQPQFEYKRKLLGLLKGIRTSMTPLFALTDELQSFKAKLKLFCGELGITLAELVNQIHQANSGAVNAVLGRLQDAFLHVYDLSTDLTFATSEHLAVFFKL